MSRNPLVACWDALQSFRRITLRDAETKQWTVDHASTLRALPGALESAPIHFFTQEGAEQCVDQYGGDISEGTYQGHSLKTCRALTQQQRWALPITVQEAHPEALPFLWDVTQREIEQRKDDYLIRSVLLLAYACNHTYIAREMGDCMLRRNEHSGLFLDELHISLIMEKPRAFGWFLQHNPAWVAALQEDPDQRDLITSWLGRRSIRAATHWADILCSHGIPCNPAHRDFNPAVGTNMNELYHVFHQDLAGQLLLARRWTRNMIEQRQDLVVSTYSTSPSLRSEVLAYMMARLGMAGVPHMEREYDALWTPWTQAIESMDVDDATFYQLAQEHTGAEMAMTIELPAHL
jgi:hypothetical protein